MKMQKNDENAKKHRQAAGDGNDAFVEFSAARMIDQPDANRQGSKRKHEGDGHDECDRD
jgi:hypothetical protein